jgi:hypothetical protein
MKEGFVLVTTDKFALFVDCGEPTNLETSHFIIPRFVSNELVSFSSFVSLLFYDYYNCLELIHKTCTILTLSNDRIL